MTAQPDHATLMDRVYRRQRHFYDLTRKYFLLGRDPMLAGLRPPDAGHVLEIGCGTGRNLIKAARLYPGVSFYGIDISRAMLATAQKAVSTQTHPASIAVGYSDARSFDPVDLFARRTFDRIFISYTLSMMPEWRDVLFGCLDHLAPGGELHIVDFGDSRGLPAWFRSILAKWLARFHVSPRLDLFNVSADAASARMATITRRRLYRGFAWVLVIRLCADENADGGTGAI